MENADYERLKVCEGHTGLVPEKPDLFTRYLSYGRGLPRDPFSRIYQAKGITRRNARIGLFRARE